MYNPTKKDGYMGLAAGLAVMGLWLAGLVIFLQMDLSVVPVYIIIPAMVVQMFLYVGLFITAHDAMHGLVFPQNLSINKLTGTVAVLLYALFPYKKLHTKHWDHHKYPGSEKDPDYHDGKQPGFFSWYLKFMRTYLSWWQVLGMAIIFNILHLGLNIPVANLMLFWAFPALASTLQLFYFGTYLPHREPNGGYTNRHNATSNDYPVLLSFITCYHFGYHLEHHEFPYVQWWKLPKVRKKWNGRVS
ncbi:MAG: beta-carotene ketolase [Marinilabiliales bacterium]|nr:MAG: beta-carotene ketolase [Marinilabiliales bacterium]